MVEKPLKYGLFLVITITIINLVVILFFSIFWRNIAWYSLLQFTLFILTSLIAALIVTSLVVLTAPVLKDYLATYRRLLRLENLSHPLLLKLSLEAPGTYHHSLAVANLAYKAAKSIAADQLLARVGGYYHDIGKLQNPQYFVENQKTGHNFHEELNNPEKSVKLIIDHVQYGLKLAEEYKIPKELAAFIPEHHGTMVISFFYNKAKEQGHKARIGDFRYPGPKPLSRETAIMMLSDAVDAKIRLLDSFSKEKITNIVDEITNERIEDKQLELSGLTEQEINKIKKSLVETLQVMFHQRIEYPKTEN